MELLKILFHLINQYFAEKSKNNFIAKYYLEIDHEL